MTPNIATEAAAAAAAAAADESLKSSTRPRPTQTNMTYRNHQRGACPLVYIVITTVTAAAAASRGGDAGRLRSHDCSSYSHLNDVTAALVIMNVWWCE